VQTVGELLKKINNANPVLFDEPMRRHTSFRIGGPADAYLRVRDEEELRRLFALILEAELPYFILGEGANILVSDRGIRGIVLDLAGLNTCRLAPESSTIIAGAGCSMSAVIEQARDWGLAGLEFAYAMPGSVGGSIYMNARCYGTSVADRLEYVDILDENAGCMRWPVRQEDFGYKHSPFQARKSVILAGAFRLTPGEGEQIDARMQSFKTDREQKGHFLFPCAGSVFKNNRDFGRPTGKIIDELGLKGTRIGDAEISNFHANIIINRGNARADEVLALIQLIEERARHSFAYTLERELLLVGDW
jgi:UDP-N-acetylmuramate dehydrogenase